MLVGREGIGTSPKITAPDFVTRFCNMYYHIKIGGKREMAYFRKRKKSRLRASKIEDGCCPSQKTKLKLVFNA